MSISHFLGRCLIVIGSIIAAFGAWQMFLGDDRLALRLEILALACVGSGLVVLATKQSPAKSGAHFSKSADSQLPARLN